MIRKYLSPRFLRACSYRFSSEPPVSYTQKSQRTKVSSFERLRMLEQIDQQTNMEVLKRELLNDTIQLPLKFLAYYSAPKSKFHHNQK